MTEAQAEKVIAELQRIRQLLEQRAVQLNMPWLIPQSPGESPYPNFPKDYCARPTDVTDVQVGPEIAYTPFPLIKPPFPVPDELLKIRVGNPDCSLDCSNDKTQTEQQSPTPSSTPEIGTPTDNMPVTDGGTFQNIETSTADLDNPKPLPKPNLTDNTGRNAGGLDCILERKGGQK